MKPWTRMVFFILIITCIMPAVPSSAQTCPELVGRWPYGPASTVEISGANAYVTMGSTLKIFDLTDPALPVELGEVSVSGPITGLSVDGSHVYLAAGESGLRIIDVSVPATPVEVGFDEISGWTTDVAVRGGHAFVTDEAAMWVFDVTTPSEPILVGIGGPFMGYASALAVNDSHAFIAVEEAGGGSDLVILDISDPTSPAQVGSMVTPASYSTDINVNGTTAFLVDETSLRLVDISDPASPSEVGSYSPFSGSPTSVVVDGSYAYLGLNRSNVFGSVDVVDITTPAAPFKMAGFDTPAPAYGVWANGHQVVVAASSAGLRIHDWWLGTELSFVEAPGSSWLVAVNGTNAFVVDSEGLRVLDVSASPPIEIGFLAGGNDLALDTDGNLIYLAGLDGLRIVDATDPTTPSEVGSLSAPLTASGLSVSGGHAYVAEGHSGVRVFGVSTPSAPVDFGVFDTPGYAYGVEASAGIAYVADGGTGGLRLFDLTVPSAPVEVGSVDTPGSCVDVAVTGNLAYVADDYMGLRVIDVSSPANPIEVGALDSTNGFFGNPAWVTLSGSAAYLTDGLPFPFSGMSVVDVGTPSAPVLAGSVRTPGTAYRTAVGGGKVFVADGEAGLTIYSQCALGPAEIFTDGFESGDSSAWAVP